MRTLFVTLLLCTVILCANAQVDGSCQHPDYAGLMALYHSTNGDSWHNKNNWDDGTGDLSCDPCQDAWFGIECDIFERVQSVQLVANNLTGVIPDDIALLRWLRRLDLSFNSIEGDLPRSLAVLQGLRILDLSSNLLDGEIPKTLCELSFLEEMIIDHNGLSGEIPACLGNLVYLANLSLSFNNLSGKLPDELGGLTELSSLDVAYNNLSGTLPIDLGALDSLEYLRVSHNDFIGGFPISYSTLCGVEHVSFGNNNSSELSDSYWPSFCAGLRGGMQADYSALIALYNATNGPEWDDNSNWDDGSAMTSINPCDDDWYGVSCFGGRVVELDLDFNRLGGVIPSEIGSLDFLERLSFYNNHIGGEIPKELGRLSDLEYLDLGLNDLMGSIPHEVGYLWNLEDFYIDGNELEGCWPEVMEGICGADRTAMDDNNSSVISDAGWVSFCNSGVGEVHDDFDALATIYINLNGSEWSNSALWNASNSCMDPCDDWYGVTCSENRVVGLDLSNNNLKGTLPEKIGSLSELSRLNLAINEIEGVFPGSLDALEKMTNINLKGNQLYGSLPWVMPWANLDTLSIGSNFISGETPNMWNSGTWRRISSMNLQGNLFSGELSLPFYSASSLKFYSVADNYMSGCLYDYNFEYCANNVTIYTNENLRLPDFGEFCSSGLGVCSRCSNDDITLDDDPFDIGHIDVVSGVVKSGGRIGMDNSVFLQAGQSIDLSDGFTVEQNANLILRIADCDYLSIRSIQAK